MNDTPKEISKELKTAIKALKQYWFGTRWDEMDIEEFEELITAINPIVYASIKAKLEKAFSVKDTDEERYMKRLDNVYDTVMFYFMFQKFILGKVAISGINIPKPPE